MRIIFRKVSDERHELTAVAERLRRLPGHWRATPFGGEMELDW